MGQGKLKWENKKIANMIFLVHYTSIVNLSRVFDKGCNNNLLKIRN